jgi:hypothetical protein
MHTNYNHYAWNTVEEVIEHVPESNEVLRTHQIDPSIRMSLQNAAAMTSNSPDELLAIMDYRARRAGRNGR